MNHGALALGGLLSLAAASPASAGYTAELVWDRNSAAVRYDVYIRFEQGVGPAPSITGRKLELQASAAPLGRDGKVHFAVTDLPVGPKTIFTVVARRDGINSPHSNELTLTYPMVAPHVDSDGDGILDADEDLDLDLVLDAGETSPTKADTDGDGLSDSDELFRTYTDPRAADSDRDGVNDSRDKCNDVDRDGYGSAVSGIATCKRDNCPLVYNPSQVDSDYDGTGELCDPCTNMGGRQLFRSRRTVLAFRKVYRDRVRGDDTIRFRGDFELPTAAGFGTLDVASSGARVLLEGVNGVPIFDAWLPGGTLRDTGTKRGWKVDERNGKYVYKDQTDFRPAGLTKVVIAQASGRSSRKVRVILKGRNGDFVGLTPRTLPLRLIVVLGDDAASLQGACGETDFGFDSCRFPSPRSVACR